MSLRPLWPPRPCAWRGASCWCWAAWSPRVLLEVAAGYGPHLDELYFLRAGAQPTWGYADQPLLAHALDVAFGGLLVGLWAPSAATASVGDSWRWFGGC